MDPLLRFSGPAVQVGTYERIEGPLKAPSDIRIYDSETDTRVPLGPEPEEQFVFTPMEFDPEKFLCFMGDLVGDIEDVLFMRQNELVHS